jgi:hypothetical protein
MTNQTILYQTKDLLIQDLTTSNTTHLVNSYYFNHCDLRLIADEHNVTRMAVISYPTDEDEYHCMYMDRADMARDDFRDILMDFHSSPTGQPKRSKRVKYIFIDGLDPSKIGKDSEVALEGGFGVQDIGKYHMQIKW